MPIRGEGLRPMRWQFVHLSADRDTARAVGVRQASEPVLLVVAARVAAGAGVAFYAGNDTVWLADSVPARFIQVDAWTATVGPRRRRSGRPSWPGRRGTPPAPAPGCRGTWWRTRGG